MAELERPLAAIVGADAPVPLLGGGTARAVNLDSAASAPALVSVAEAVAAALPLSASVHRGAGYASRVCTAAYEQSRAEISAYFGARAADEVVITRNTTDAINLLASVVPGRAILLDIEHHANLLPWRERGATVLPAAGTLAETVERIEAELDRAPAAVLAVTGASNVTGEVLPLRRLADIAHRRGTRLAVDAAQLAPHRRIDMTATGIDYLAFSGHKLYAPFGAGALVGRADWLDAGAPHLRGGGAVSHVSLDSEEWRLGPERHEAGTPNVLGAIAIAAAVRELATLDTEEWLAHERGLREFAVRELERRPGVTVHRLWSDAEEALGVITVSVRRLSAEPMAQEASLVAAVLSAESGVAVRDGNFCAHPLLRRLGVEQGAVRLSFGLGSSADDVRRLLAGLDAYLEHGPAHVYRFVGGRWQPEHDARPLPDWIAPGRAERSLENCVA